MAYESSDGRATTRRRFVIETLGGIAGAAVLGACGSGESGEKPGGGTGGEAQDGAGGVGGEVESGAPSAGGAGAGGANAGAGGANVGAAGAVTRNDAGAAGGAASDSGTCALYPQETEGPFYLDLGLLRSDVTEGKPGAPLQLEIRVVTANGCAPLPGAAVDIWQCDAAGIYDGFPGQLGGLNTTGKRSLRGTQITDSEGRVVFHTIYPGWYPGRTTHIHFKVHLSPTSEVTSQLYFPEATTAQVYLTPPYDAHGQKDTSNAADGTAHVGGMPPLLTVSESAGAYTGKLVVSVLG